jgi:hypothetical protein
MSAAHLRSAAALLALALAFAAPSPPRTGITRHMGAWILMRLPPQGLIRHWRASEQLRRLRLRARAPAWRLAATTRWLARWCRLLAQSKSGTELTDGPQRRSPPATDSSTPLWNTPLDIDIDREAGALRLMRNG